MARRNVSNFRTRSPRRINDWGVGPGTGASAGGNQAIMATGPTIATQGSTVSEELTLVRTRGELLLYLTSASAQGGGFFGAFGIAKVSNPAFTAGIASVPTPVTEEDWDGWLYHRFFAVQSGGIIDGSVSADQDYVTSVSGVLRLEVDSKAMRKLDANDVIFGALEVTEVGTASMNWAFNSRILFKLS